MRSIRDCPCAVLGGCGFLGSHLTDFLLEDRGCDVLAVDNLCAGRREFLHPQARFEHFDITGSEDDLRRLFKCYRVRYIFNMVARPYVPDSYERPLLTFDVNAMGALKAINAAQEAGVEAFLQVSSAEVYGGGQFGCITEANRDRKDLTEPIDECGIVLPHSSYGASKAAIDALVQVRWREARSPVIALRQFNCIGERETHPYVVPEVISQLAVQSPRGEGFVRLGNNSARDFLYAGDAVRMAVELLEKGQFGECYNSGSQESIRIYDLAKRIGKLMHFSDVVVEEDPARVRAWEIWSLRSCNDKLYSVIDYRPQVSLEEALRRTVAYYEASGRRWCWEGGHATARAS